nr:hypothetical protein [Tanacetum cinerariifolium]
MTGLLSLKGVTLLCSVSHIVEDFVKRLRSSLGEECNYYKEPTELEIQEMPVGHTSAEQKVARRNELKAHGTLLVALPDKHQLKFNSHKDAKTLMEAIENSESLDQIHDRLQKLVSQLDIHRVSLSQEDVNLKFLRSLPSEWKTHTLIWRNKANLEEQSLDDLFNSFKIYENEVKHSSSTSTATQNLAFVSSSNTDSTTDSVGAAASVYAVCAKLPMSSLPNVDSLSNTMAMLTMRARRFLQKTGINLSDNRPTSIGFDMSKLECYNCHIKGNFARDCRSPKDSRRPDAADPQRRTVPVETSTSNALVSQYDGTGSYDWGYQAEEEPAKFSLMAFSPLSSSSNNEVPSCSKPSGLESVEARLLVYKQNESIFEENIKLLNIEVQVRDNALVTLRQKLEKAEQERDDLKLKLDKFQTSSKNLTELLASQINEKHGLGYFSSESDYESCSPSSLFDRSQPSGGYHAVPPPITGTFMPPKPDLVFHTAPIDVETDHSAFTVQLSTSKPAQDFSHTNRPSAPIIEDWVSDSKDESDTTASQNVPSFVQPTSPKSNSSSKIRNRKTCFVCKSVDHLIKDCDHHAKKMDQPTPRNYAHIERAAKRRKLNEEVEDLKRHLEIIPDEDDDVYTEATPLARKVPVVDYEIIEISNKPYYKIIRADGTHLLYISFLTLLKNFDREDLEALWNMVKERFSTSKPKNFFDDFLLTTLGAMFEKPDTQDQV